VTAYNKTQDSIQLLQQVVLAEQHIAINYDQATELAESIRTFYTLLSEPGIQLITAGSQ
jgi:hypothetical protein